MVSEAGVIQVAVFRFTALQILSFSSKPLPNDGLGLICSVPDYLNGITK